MFTFKERSNDRYIDFDCILQLKLINRLYRFRLHNTTFQLKNLTPQKSTIKTKRRNVHDARLRHAIVIDGHVRKTAVTGRVFDRCHSHWSSCARAHFSAADESAVRCDNAPASKLPLFSSLESSHLSLLTGHKPQR